MRRSRPSLPLTLLVVSMAFASLPGVGRGQTRDAVPAAAPDSVAVAQTVRAFHRALVAGDSEAVRALLADDVQVAESGGVESRDDYLAHHMPADMAFAAAVVREPGTMHVTVAGDVAWAVSTSRATGTFRDRAIDARGAELMVLSRQDGSWWIRAIHWSSRASGS
jgi:ketosteroid isomerase-like protein